MITILAASCDKYNLWWNTWEKHLMTIWPDCPYERKIMTNFIKGQGKIDIGEDIGWNRNLLVALKEIKTDYILLTLENHIIISTPDTEKIKKVIQIMESDIGMVQLSRCSQPEKIYEEWNDLAIFDRTHHPFKICSLRATPLWKKDLLIELVEHLISTIPKEKDAGRQGAIEFEVEGTKYYTQNVNNKYPYKVLGINRENGGASLYDFSDASIEGKQVKWTK